MQFSKDRFRLEGKTFHYFYNITLKRIKIGGKFKLDLFSTIISSLIHFRN